MNNIDSKKAAEILDIPEIALGQCMFDGKIAPRNGFNFSMIDIEHLINNESEYLESLK
jgi:hypothetical protein